VGIVVPCSPIPLDGLHAIDRNAKGLRNLSPEQAQVGPLMRKGQP
jgi:hypothetical protein